VAYLDNAATTFPKPDEVYDFMDEFYRKYGSSFGRGSYKSEKNVSKLISDTREKIKKEIE
jgi:selenocysteine lyase/cysteine desulfurase